RRGTYSKYRRQSPRIMGLLKEAGAPASEQLVVAIVGAMTTVRVCGAYSRLLQLSYYSSVRDEVAGHDSDNLIKAAHYCRRNLGLSAARVRPEGATWRAR